MRSSLWACICLHVPPLLVTTLLHVLLQHQSVVGFSGLHNLCLLWFQLRCLGQLAPSVWNSLPTGICACSSSNTFPHLLKTDCFKQAFSSPSASHKCLRFDFWLRLCMTLNLSILFIYLFIYLLTHIALNYGHLAVGGRRQFNKIRLAEVPICRPSWWRLAGITATSLLATFQLMMSRLDVTLCASLRHFVTVALVSAE